MTYLILSDTHLDHRFYEKKYRKLVSVISSVDRVIINGDLWDGLTCNFDDFLNSKWNQLFPLLLEKKAKYIYGNHDFKVYSDDRVSQFCVSTHDQLDLTIGKTPYHFMHGHQIVSLGESKPLKRTTSERVVERAIQLMFVTSLKILGTYYPFYLHRKWTATMKAWKPTHLPNDTWLVTGHSHWANLDADLHFCNTGFFNFGFAQYGIIEDGNIRLVNDRY